MLVSSALRAPSNESSPSRVGCVLRLAPQHVSTNPSPPHTHTRSASMPNLKPPDKLLPHQPPRSMLFFGSTAAMTVDEFHESLLHRTKEQYIADLAAQQHVNSVILTSKFRHLQNAYR